MGNLENSSSETKEKDIILRAQKGEETAFNLLVESHLKLVFNFSLKYLKNSEATEEAVQETFLKVWKNLKKYNVDKNFRTWLLTICKNTCLDMLRKHQTIPFSEIFKSIEDFSNERISTTYSENISYSLGIENKIQNQISQLPEDYQTILYLRTTKDLSFKQISLLTHKPLNTVKSQYLRTVKILKQYFSK
jgi:RNA polymerase sigma-70 factor, ECF subfamily